MSYSDFAAQRLEFLALQTLHELAGRPSIAEAVVFTSVDGAPQDPAAPVGDPQPKTQSSLQLPMGGRVVAQGFDRLLADEEKAVVQARFAGWPHMWLSNS